jgi:hypothetical protein
LGEKQSAMQTALIVHTSLKRLLDGRFARLLEIEVHRDDFPSGVPWTASKALCSILADIFAICISLLFNGAWFAAVFRSHSGANSRRGEMISADSEVNQAQTEVPQSGPQVLRRSGRKIAQRGPLGC